MPRVTARLGLFLMGVAAAAAAQPPPAARPVPDLTGRWAPATCVPDGATCPFDVDALPLTRAGRNLMAAFEEPLGPKFDCVQATVPSLLADPYRWALHQLTDRVIFEYEKDDIVALDQARRVTRYAQPDAVPNLRSSGQSEPTRGGVPVGADTSSTRPQPDER
jgi:hypothetical protein